MSCLNHSSHGYIIGALQLFTSLSIILLSIPAVNEYITGPNETFGVEDEDELKDIRVDIVIAAIVMAFFAIVLIIGVIRKEQWLLMAFMIYNGLQAFAIVVRLILNGTEDTPYMVYVIYSVYLIYLFITLPRIFQKIIRA